MTAVRPIYKKLLLIAIVIYVIGVSVALADLYCKIGNIEHTLSHMKDHACDIHKH